MVYRLRGTLLPIISLTSLLNTQEEKTDDSKTEDQEEEKILQIIVVDANDCRFGIIVDSIQSTQDIVVKPLSNKIKELLIYSGVTILGNGDVALILDLNELARKAKLNAEKHSELMSENNKHALLEENNLSLVLLVENDKKNQIAVPIDLVKRLEKITVKNIEFVAGKNVVQYHDKILTLIKLSELIDNDSVDLSNHKENLDIFVYSHQGTQDIGIIINKIIDSSNEDISKPQGAARSGITGTAIIKNKITEILDKDTLHEKIISYVS